MQKAQDLRCKKIRVMIPTSKPPRPRLIARLSGAQAEVDLGASGSFVETDEISGSFAGQTNATPPMSDLASPQNRDTTHPLTPDEIQLIKTVCGIFDIDVGAAPICQNAHARFIGANYTGV